MYNCCDENAVMADAQPMRSVDPTGEYINVMREREMEREKKDSSAARSLALLLRCTRGSGGEVARDESMYAEQRCVRWELGIVTSIYKTL